MATRTLLEPTLAIKPLHPLFAAEATGVDLREPLDPRLIADIDAAMDQYAVLVLPNQHLDDDQQLAFAKHSMLHAREIPPEGGETEFADMRAAWDALPDKTRSIIEPLVCDHSLIFSRAMLGFDAFKPEEQQAFAPVPQRLVRRHAGSGRRSIYLSAHIGGIHDWPRPEAMMLIRDLTEHATQCEFVFRHTWRQYDLVIWDNRCTMHRGRPYDDKRYKRDMRRMTLQDSAPTLEQAV